MDTRAKIQDEQLENTVRGPVQTPEQALADVSTDLNEGMVFETSGSSGSPKQIPCRNTDHLIESMVDAFRLAGLEDGALLNLGAPLPHVSAWGFRQAIDRLGGYSANQHFRDFETVIEDGSAAEVTAVAAAPSVGRAIGKQIAEAYGPVPEIFPNLEWVGCGGDLLTEAKREALRDIWGAETIRDFYGTSEFFVLGAAVDDTREQIPLLHRFILEIIPDDDPDDIVDIREVTEETRGSILITAPDREAVDFTRYRIGDKITVHPTDDIPRITILGREDDSINLSGALLYPAQIHEAVRETYGLEADWVARVSEQEYPAVDFHIIGGGPADSEQFRTNLFQRNSPVKQAYHDVGVIEYLDVHHAENRDEIPGLSSEGGMKKHHVVFEDPDTDRIRG